MPRLTIEHSSIVREIEYRPETARLVVVWYTFAAYEYEPSKDTPADITLEGIYNEVCTARDMKESVGSLLKRRLKQGNFTFTKIN